MKKLMISTLLMCAIAAQAETVGDTLVIKNPEKVTIATTNSEQHISIKGARFSSDFRYDQRISIADSSAVRREFSSLKDFNRVRLSKCKNSKDKKGTVDASLHLNVGMTTMTGAPTDYKYKLGVGEIGLALTADWHPYGPKNTWSIGFGVNWRRYYMNKNIYLFKDYANGEYLTPASFDASQSERSHSMYTFALQVPVMYEHAFDQKGKWTVGLGAIVNINTGAHLTAGYTENDLEYERRTYKIGQRPITVDLMLKVGTPYFADLYVKYCPMTYFKSNRGPKTHQLSFGICF